jgi:nicotinamide phosphoribosyltransferase
LVHLPNSTYLDYLKTVINSCKSGDIVSIVLDGYDIFRDTELLCKELKDHIIESGVKVVVRLDSGDAYEVAPKVIDIIESYFGHTVNSKGFKVLNNVSLIQGDGIDTDTMGGLCSMIELLGYAAETLVYGSGGGLLQKVNRDTYSFAQNVLHAIILSASIGMFMGFFVPPAISLIVDYFPASR